MQTYTLFIYTHTDIGTHMFIQKDLLNLFSVVNMYMCLALVAWH